MPGAWHCRLCCRHSKQRVVPFPICYLFVSVFGWRDRLPMFGPITLIQLPLTLHRAFWTQLVDAVVLLSSEDVVGRHQSLPPSEMAVYLLHLFAPSEMVAYLLHVFAPSEMVACWKQFLVPLEPGAPLDGVIGGVLLSPRRDGSQFCR